MDVQQFIAATKVNDLVADTEAQLKAKTGTGKIPVYSDLIKIENGKECQYVNYVQEGGGVLGVALVGYTYVLEKLGFRFLKLAGTSAGAINTAFLAAVDAKNYVYDAKTNEAFSSQSEIILYEMLHYNFWNMVDGSKFGKVLISTAIKAKNNFKVVVAFLISCLALVFLSALVFATCYLFNIYPTDTIINVMVVIAWLALLSALAILVVVVVTAYYFRRFSDCSFGINPGHKFHYWITEVLRKNNVFSSKDMEKKMAARLVDIKLRPERAALHLEDDDNAIAPPFLSIVASDITNQTKVEFPLMAKEYWVNPDLTNPADFVRASMSIPIFFEPFQVDVSEVLDKASVKTKLPAFAENLDTPGTKKVQFVDGGVLSNFPMSVFHNPNIVMARMPTFGVKLEDTKHDTDDATNKKALQPKQRLFDFLYSMANTVRFNYDRDFLKKNVVYEMGIGHIDVADFNWLDFGLDDKAKQDLFIQGAKAAQTFLLGGPIWVDGKLKQFEAFDWLKFKEERAKMVRGSEPKVRV